MTPHRRRSVFADRLLEFPEFAFIDEAWRRHRGAWREFFSDRIGSSFDGRIVLEVGCADADFLIRIAEKHPTTAFIGLDWKFRALFNGASRITEAGLQNVVLLHGRAQDIRRIFADREIDEIWVFHPEPCDKPHELPNRLLAEPFLADVHHVLRTAGDPLILKTDHRGYYEWVLSHFAQGLPLNSLFEVTASSADFWADEKRRSESTRAFAGEKTMFESRFVNKRRPIHYIELTKRLPGEEPGHP